MLTFTNAALFDGVRPHPATDRLNVTVAGDRIVKVSDEPPAAASQIIDCRGRTLMPGLIDAHVHVYALDVNVMRIAEAPPTLYAHFAALSLRRMLDRGFTSVRDAGGADYGLYLALERGYIAGPRLFYCGSALSQTGGHGDFRHQHHHQPGPLHGCACGHASALTVIVDGVDAVLSAVRENFRRGASFIKFMGSGGVSSTGDALESIQFSDEEVSAIVGECERHGRYCTAHIHPDAALRRAIELGVHCIEHGTLVSAETAALAAARGTCIVPTLSTIAALAEHGAELGYPPEAVGKLDRIKDEAVERLRHLKAAGVKVGLGTDLLGPLERYQCREFELRSQIFSSIEILRQATSVNAEILRQQGELGIIKEGALADLIVVDGDPIGDLSLLGRDGESISVIMSRGGLHRNRLAVKH
jgi:imidazolonepropionase-like amidohydrolase